MNWVEMLGWIAIAIAFFSGCCSLLLFTSLRRNQQDDRQRLDELQRGQRLLQGQLVNMGQRLLTLEKQMTDVALNASASAANDTVPKAPAVDLPDDTYKFTYQQYTEGTSSFGAGANASDDDLDQMAALAQKMLAAGEDPAVVAERCKLSQSEIDLLQAMHTHSTT